MSNGPMQKSPDDEFSLFHLESEQPPRADKSAPTGIQVHFLRQGSNELDRSSSPERSSPVMLSAGAATLSPSLRSRVNSAKGKHLAAERDRPFAALRVTVCDCSNCQGLFFTIEPCLKFIIAAEEPNEQPLSAINGAATP